LTFIKHVSFSDEGVSRLHLACSCEAEVIASATAVTLTAETAVGTRRAHFTASDALDAGLPQLLYSREVARGFIEVGAGMALTQFFAAVSSAVRSAQAFTMQVRTLAAVVVMPVALAVGL
jgi:hypothetical protein